MKNLLTIAALLVATAAHAQTPPPLIPYSGAALDDAGQAQVGPLSVTFGIYQASGGGDALWTEMQQVTPDAQGRYTVLLGLASGGVPLELFQGGTARWLGAQADGQSPQPRSLLAVSVPYALKAGDANTIGGLPPSAFFLTTPRSGGDSGDGPVTAVQTVNDDFTATGRTSFGTATLAGALHSKSAVTGSTGIGNAVSNAGAFIEGSSASTWGLAVGLENSSEMPFVQGVNLAQLGARDLLLNPFGGTVGIGTSTPNMNVGLHVNGMGGMHLQGSNLGVNIKFQNATNENGFLNYHGANFHIYANSGQVATLTVTGGAPGRVGIGTTSPMAILHVAGSIQVDGNIAAKYQDVAEWVVSSEALVSGEVVVIDPARTNQVMAARRAYDTRVAGAISQQPGVVLGERGEGKVLVAQSGRVRSKADARFGAIGAGDLLVTSPTAGHAMKSQGVVLGEGIEMHRPGTLVGKALEALESGQGDILVLLTLQ